MKALRANLALLTALVLLLGLSVGAAYAQTEEPIPACEGDTVSGTVVAADENTGEVTIDQDGGLCTVQFGSDFEHPITSLLGAHFNGLDLNELEDHVENLEVEVVCDETEGSEVCALADSEDDRIMVRVTDITDNGDGPWTVEFVYTDEDGNPVTGTFVTEDAGLAESLGESLKVVSGEFQLVTDDEGNVFFEGAGDEIQTLHEDGMGFGVIVKLFAIAAEADQACQAGSSESEPSGEGDPAEETTFDPCTVSVQSLLEFSKNGLRLGLLFREFGRPSILGVGHVRNNGGPPDNACGYWRNHGDGFLPVGCEAKEGGKPPWAGSPGGPNGDDGDD